MNKYTERNAPNYYYYHSLQITTSNNAPMNESEETSENEQ